MLQSNYSAQNLTFIKQFHLIAFQRLNLPFEVESLIIAHQLKTIDGCFLLFLLFMILKVFINVLRKELVGNENDKILLSLRFSNFRLLMIVLEVLEG